ncbi:hypothetical protein OG871_05490 [Kitasatospora sp. NBC_00374]|uniref:hypothetical protein n=1 Tax=Kitasatospora sp. NBC_00374 TaxID=2975964 RepID=UPI0030E00218
MVPSEAQAAVVEKDFDLGELLEEIVGHHVGTPLGGQGRASTAQSQARMHQQRAGAWEDRFPDTIRTEAVGEAIRIVIEEQL